MTDVIYTGEDHKTNWFFSRYYYTGGNSRYYTFQIAINLLRQRHTDPVIIETGCQRQEEDVGAGMSTSIFAEYVQRYGGFLITVDNDPIHLDRAKGYVSDLSKEQVFFIEMDSVQFLRDYNDRCDLLYLDSLDWPIAEHEGNVEMQQKCINHCLNEFKAIEERLGDNTILLVDDNQIKGGGKPQLLKPYLIQKDWICILDLQSTLWIKNL